MLLTIISLSDHTSLFYQVPLFQDTDDLSFIRLLCTKCKPFQFHAGEYIVRKGDIGQEMFIIKNGLVSEEIALCLTD